MKTSGPVWLKPLVDYGPLAAFFIAYLLKDLFAATLALMVTTVIAVTLALIIERRVPIMPVVTAVIVMIFGGLTIWLQDERFIKMKPTIVQALFAVALFGGLLFQRPLLKPMLQSAWRMDDRGWHVLTFRFAVFFAGMAVLNELVWRYTSTDIWVNFKIFGILILTVIFTMLQLPVLNRHQLPDAASEEPPPPGP